MGGQNEWSVLRPNLLDAAATLIFGREPTAAEVSRVRVLFNTWANSGAITVAPDARSEAWRSETERSDEAAGIDRRIVTGWKIEGKPCDEPTFKAWVTMQAAITGSGFVAVIQTDDHVVLDALPSARIMVQL